ncbi:SDR family oxidoreductase [Meridianimarinicoccus sp. RP-17]|uniref:SDR family oxidoreductase n=1 Tax=Meridianimarinicoccus zhengii TaxID=2056810 RepID=UPI000DACB946|nr:SDR family oxidoreductase [Phycocomes zhengii]
MRLTGKRLLVTAAGQGMGRAAVIACASEGAQVLATDRDPGLLDGLAEHGIETAQLDVTDPDGIRDIASRVGALDGLFNCAGIVHHGTILDLSDADWAHSVDTNITSMVRLSRACLPGLLARAADTGTASIVNMASMASSIKGFPNRAAYGATKAAVIGLTKAIAADFVTTGLRCNAVCPGTVDTPSLRGRIAAAPDPVKAEKDFIARQPMGRLATVDDVIPLIVYLLSDESRFVTGQAMLADGGVTI